MTEQPRNLVNKLRQQLEAEVGSDCFELWFAPENSLEIQGSKVVVCASDEFSLERIQSSYQNAIATVATSLGMESVDFEVASFESGNLQSAKQDCDKQDTDKRDNDNPNYGDLEDRHGKEKFNENSELGHGKTKGVETNLDDVRSGQAGFVKFSPEPGAKGSLEKGQSIRDEDASRLKQARKSNRYTLQDFVFDSSNEMIRKACLQLIQYPGDISPFYIHGATGTGKTHLLEGIAMEARRRSRSGRVQLVTAEHFTSDYIGSLKNRTMPMFRKRYRELDFLLIDDLQFFAGKKSTLSELQQTIEVVTRRGGQVVVTADRSPTELDFAEPEFVRRVSCGVTAQIQTPCQETREKIVLQLSQKKSLRIETAAVELIADKISGDIRLISGALNRLRLFQLIEGKPISLADAKSQLSDLFQISHRSVSIPEIEKAVCNLFGLEQKCLRSATKVKAVSQPRMLAMWLSRKYTRAALSEIGEYFGGRSHSTVISAQTKVDRWVKESELIGLRHSEFPVENAIRRIEQELRVG